MRANAGCFHKGTSRPYFQIIPLLLACLTFLPMALAVDPPPDGGYLNQNTAEGQDALFSLTTGAANTAVGFDALFRTTTGSSNTASGFQALFSNTTGAFNTANGANALLSNTTGNANTAYGASALLSNTTGSNNTASGQIALYFNTTGGSNTANGFAALSYNTTGSFDTADGLGALYNNTTGSNNTAEGYDALLKNTTGNNNIAIGNTAGASLTIGSNNIEIGNRGVHNDSNTIRIGTEGTQTQTFVAGISGTTVAGGVGVVIDTNGQLGTLTSSARYKEAIHPIADASEAILSLKPVAFRYKKELDPKGLPQFGLVAEDVAKVNPDLVARDEQGKPYTVRYEAVNAMLLNEFLKAHQTIETQEQKIQALELALKQQGTQIEKISAQLSSRRSAARLVVNE